MQKTPTVPLRERNRLDTWALIHDKASALALEEGLTKTTVEAIAEAAGISKRTFFNYFATKEDAIMGTQPPTLPDEAVAAFHADSQDDLFGRTVRLMVAVIRSMFPEASQQARRKELKNKYPELARTVFLHVSASELLVESILMDRYDDADPEFARAGVPSGRDGAKALLMLAGTAMRFAFSRNPSAVSAGETKAVDESIEIFREAIKATL
ncbi:helix-turn-helix domain-containing protein [Specibacter sp. NPDC078709]|uniref:TetR/AcrR family transcriptional regulator n=1 Tax=Specibacter sp. NPDC078709 TaxID=3154364 RepID=UPI0034208695